jgi:hypothetical protein
MEYNVGGRGGGEDSRKKKYGLKEKNKEDDGERENANAKEAT